MPFCVVNKKTKKKLRRYSGRDAKKRARAKCAQFNKLHPRTFTVKRCR